MKISIKISAFLLMLITGAAFSLPKGVNISGVFGYQFGQTINEKDSNVEWCINSICSALNKDSSPHNYAVGLRLNRDGQIYQISTANKQRNNPECFQQASRLAGRLSEEYGIEFENKEEITEYFYYRSWKFSNYDATPVEIAISCFDYTVGKKGAFSTPDKYSFNVIYTDNRYGSGAFVYRHYIEQKNKGN